MATTSTNLLNILEQKWNGCNQCSIRDCPQVGEYVHFRGETPCDILFIGEAPGEQESLIGEPFVSLSGEILDELIADSVLGSIKWCICNLVACRPTEKRDGRVRNRTPVREEILACEDHLLDIFYAAKPDAIVCVGVTALENLPDEISDWKLPTLNLKHPAWIARKGGIGSVPYADEQIKLEMFVEECFYA